MNTRQLPGTDLTVSSICMGTGDWGAKPGQDDPARVYAAFREAGGNIFDTAHCYAFWVDQLGTPERLLGQFVRQESRRQDVVVCTKGCHITGGPKYPRPERYMTPELLNRDLAESLERTGLEYIDLYYLHRDDPAVPVGEIMDALDGHRRAGRIRHFAASNWRSGRIARANSYAKNKAYQGFVASQVLWNLAVLNHAMPPDLCVMDDAEQDWYAAEAFPVLPYTATANGYFAGEGEGGPGGGYRGPVSAARRERCRQLAARKGATPIQVALAYLQNQPFPVIPIIGTSKLAHLSEQLAADRVSLTPSELKWLKDGDA